MMCIVTDRLEMVDKTSTVDGAHSRLSLPLHVYPQFSDRRISHDRQTLLLIQFVLLA